MAREQQLSDVLSEFARTMATDYPIQHILDHLVERIVDILPVTGAGVTLIAPGSGPRYVAASNDDALRFEQLQTELTEGPCLAAYHTGEAVAVPDLRHEDRFPHFTPRALEAGLGAVFTFPLRHGDRRLGALDLYRDTRGKLSAKAMVAAQTLADVAAAYLVNAQGRADLKKASDLSREAALHDALTGLPNRTLMLERLEHALQRWHRSGKTVAVFFVDLDRFKVVNDTYGHRVGDELLVAVAARLGGMLRPDDTLARLSGDEFVILCEDLDNPLQADLIALRVEAAVAQPFVLAGVEVQISASVGIALADRGNTASGQLLHDADRAMYQAKRHGEGFAPLIDLRDGPLASHHHGRGLSDDLRAAVAAQELHLEYQPIVGTVDGRINGVEALLRWTHPERGPIPPSVIVPLAEQSGLIADIGCWVLAQAWRERRRWQHQLGVDDLAMSVNVSARQLMSAGFSDTVAGVLAADDSRSGLLTLEVTESVFLSDGERALLVLEDLRDLGVMLALDDFGTGYSSLRHLKRLPVNVIKVDRPFVADLGRDPASHTIVGAVVQMAHGLGLQVVAEGVETDQQHREVAALGCDSSQGFYFAPPLTSTGLDALIGRSVGGGLHLPVPAPTAETAG